MLACRFHVHGLDTHVIILPHSHVSLFLFFSMFLFFYHLHLCLQSLMWFQPAHHSHWLLQHLSGFSARAQALPTLCVDVAEQQSPEVIQSDQKRVLKCCLVHMGRANPVVLESMAAF